MRILIADKFPEEGLAHLRDQGHAIQFEPDATAEQLPEVIGATEVLVVRSTRVTGEAIRRADELALIVRAGAGTNTIDKEAAATRAIHVSNVPGRNAVAVAELTLGLLLAIDRRIPDNVADLRMGTWNKATYSKGTGLMGRPLGIVGTGAIGLAVATRAAAFGLDLHAVSKPRRPATDERLAELDFTFHPSLGDLAEAVDILSFHVPAAPETTHLVNAQLLDRMRPASVLLNTSRAEVVDEAALLDALDGKDLWVGLDVFDDEPGSGSGEISSALAAHPRVYGTHHIGASTAQAQAAVAKGTLEVIDAFASGSIINCVNLEAYLPDTTRVTIRHEDVVGVLAGVLTVIRDAGINVENMSNQVFQGARAATATLDLKGSAPPELIDRLNAIPEVIHARVNT